MLALLCGIDIDVHVLASSAVFLIMLPLFAISGVLAFLLLREMQKEEKKSAKKGNETFPLLAFNILQVYQLKVYNYIAPQLASSE